MGRFLFSLLSFILFANTVFCQANLYQELKDSIDATSLPILHFFVDYDSINTDSFISGTVEIVDYQKRTVSDTTVSSFNCLIKFRGASSTYLKKKSFALKLTDKDGKDMETGLMGMRKDDGWILDAMAIDRARMRNRVCFDIWNKISHTPYDTEFENRNGTEGVFVEVFIDSCYQGLYCLTDKIDRKLLGLKKYKTDSHGDTIIRGLMYKGRDWSNNSIYLAGYTDQRTDTVDWNAWELQYPDDIPSDKTWQPLMDLIDFCSTSTSEQFSQNYSSYFYIDNLVDYMLLTLAMNVGDNLYKNTYLSTVDLSLRHRWLITPWDMDMSLYGYWDGSYYDQMASVDRYDNVAPYDRLRADNIDGFNDRLKNRWIELYTTVFHPDSICAILDDYGMGFVESGAWQREYTKWNDTKIPLKKSVMSELALIKDWYRRNYRNLCEQFNVELPAGINSSHYYSQPATIYTIDGRKVGERPVGMYLNPGVYLIDGQLRIVR